MQAEQRPVGGLVTIPIGGSRQYAYEADETEYISIVELVAGVRNVIEAQIKFRSEGGQPLNMLIVPSDGEDDANDDLVSTNPGSYPIPVSEIVGETRYLMLVRLDPGDRVIFDLNNTDGANARNVRFRAEIATTLRAALATIENARGDQS